MPVPNIKCLASVLLAIYLSSATGGLAQNNGHAQDSGSSSKNASGERAATKLPNPVTMNLLIRSTLIALNNANKSGNYSVLRDLGAPAFQQLNTAASLAEQFQRLRKTNVDFAPIFYFHPNLSSNPAIESNRFLRLKGYMPTKPSRINFDLLFQRTKSDWLLVAIKVDTSKAVAKTSKKSPKPGAARTAAINQFATSSVALDPNTGKVENTIPQQTETEQKVRINLGDIEIPSRSPSR